MACSKQLPPSTTPFFPNHFIKNQFRTKPQLPPNDTDITGKIAIVTGSNTGLGLECATQLLSYKLTKLIMAVRSVAKGENAAEILRKRYPGAVVSVWELDMASYDSIRAFVARADKELSRLDIAILNAGKGFGDFKIASATGHEETIQVNYLSTMLLAILLLPILKNNSPAGLPGRLTISTAMLSITAKFPNKNEVPLLPSFDDKKHFDPMDIYSTSKLLGQLFIWKLTDMVSADDVVVNLVEPGFVKGTELHRDRSVAASVLMGLFKATAARTVKVGASTYVDASIIKGKESHGCIVANWEIAPYAPFQYTHGGLKVMHRLWQETVDEFSFIDVNNILESL
ncbi:putative Short-chain dehydrogenase/reductase family protein [Seiridium cardinale]